MQCRLSGLCGPDGRGEARKLGRICYGNQRKYALEDPRQFNVELFFGPYGGSWHAMVRYHRLMIDWTARQFDPDLPFPHVYRVALMKVGTCIAWRPLSFLPRAGGELPRY